MGCAQSVFKVDGDIEDLYSLDKCIGEGVEGQVYLATCKATGKHVAIKLVARGADLGLGPEKVRREIQLQARLDHVNIVELKQILLTRHHLAIVMSYAGGGDLHSYARKYTMNEEVARYFFRQIVAGLEYCHTHHIAHRDLKLANFLLTTEQPMRVLLCDFGCARHWETKQVPEKRLARFGTFAGTPAYMSPQVLQSAFYPTNTYNAIEADVWALGIVLCHLFFGANTPYWLEPNAFRNDGQTMQARIESMREQNWSDSNAFLKEHAVELSPELRDLLDKIFVADEFKRITIQGIKEHPWYVKELPPFLQGALDGMAQEQVLRDSLQRATVSLAANRHDTGLDGVGDFATIDLLVDLAQKHRKMPGGNEERVFVLDMAHMDLGPLSAASTDTNDSSLHKAGLASPAAAADIHTNTGSSHIFRSDSANATSLAAAAAAAAPNGSLYGAPLPQRTTSLAASTIGENEAAEDNDGEGTQHTQVSSKSYSNALDRVAQTGNRSTHLQRISGEGGGGADGALQGRFRKTLALRRSDSGLVVGSYVLEPMDSSISSAAKSSWMQAAMSAGGGSRAARSVHGGAAFFREAACKADSSTHVVKASACTSRTVHGGTAHAAAGGGNQHGNIFYQGQS